MSSERGLFVLVLRIFGLYLLAHTVMELPVNILSDLRNIIRYEEMTPTWAELPTNAIPPLIEAWVGSCLLLRGKAIAEYICPAQAGLLCPCGYNLVGSVTNRCPECGLATAGAVTAGSLTSGHDSLADNPHWLACWLPRLIPILIALLLCLVLLKDISDRFSGQAAPCGC
jgi:hypothetical protein